MGVPGSKAVYRCCHCNGVWGEAVPDVITALGKLTNASGGYRPWDETTEAALSRGSRD
jgi:hypothetical protein